MNRTKAIIYYVVISLLSIVAILALVRLPSIIFVGIEDITLSILFYVFAILGIFAFSLNIVDFFMIKLCIYNLFRMEEIEHNNNIKQIVNDYKYIKNELYECKREIKYIKKGN